MSSATPKPAILVIAGVDSSGGAGIAADIRAAQEMGVDARLAVTAVTAQTDRSVGGISFTSASLVAEQIALALDDGAVRAVKIGMLGRAEIVAAVASSLSDVAARCPLVLDPVLASTSGRALLDAAGVAVLIERLLPLAALVTPNLPELERLAMLCGVIEPGASMPRSSALAIQAQALHRAGALAVLVKGGHAAGALADDLLFRQGLASPVVFSARRLAVTRRGTGCRLSTAIAASLASGEGLEDACGSAKVYLTGILARELDRSSH